MNGTMTMSMYFTGDLSGSYTLTKLVMSYNNVTVSSSYDATTVSDTFSGDITITFAGDGITIAGFSYTAYFDRDGKTYKIENIDYSSGSISGRFYHPDHGYVDITTDAAFTYDSTTKQYCGGVIRITGKDATDSTIYSTISVNAGCTTYTACFDVTGVNDCGSGPINWH